MVDNYWTLLSFSPFCWVVLVQSWSQNWLRHQHKFLCSLPDGESSFCFKLGKLEMFIIHQNFKLACQKALWNEVLLEGLLQVSCISSQAALEEGLSKPSTTILYLAILASAHCRTFRVQHFSVLKKEHQEGLCNKSKMSNDVENVSWLKKRLS